MEEDYLGWLALMRHHGAPSRLLDWTLSPYVAAYFALYEGFKKQSVDLHCAVWAIDIKWLNEHAWRVLARGEYKEGSVALDSAQFQSVLLHARPLVVAALRFRSNWSGNSLPFR
jgi:hypothetical protein